MDAGLLGEWQSPDELLRAIAELRARGYSRLDAFTPSPVPGMDDALGLPRSRLPWLVFPVAVLAPLVAYAIQWYCNAVSYPLDSGGRPAHAGPAFIPIAFETLVLVTVLFALLVFFLLAGLPRLAHPMFAVEGFERASVDRYFLAIDATDPSFDKDRAAADLRQAGARRVEPFGERAS